MKAAPSTVLVASLLAGACGPQRVPLEIQFPSVVARNTTQSIQIRQLPGAMTCPEVIAAVRGGSSPMAGTVLYNMSICSIESAAFSSPEPGSNYLVQGLDATGTAILAGCTPAMVFPGGTVRVVLFPTNAFLETTPPSSPFCGGGV